MPAFGNRNNWRGGVAQWPEIRVRVRPELKEALNAIGWESANAQALKILNRWWEAQQQEARDAKKKAKKKTPSKKS